MRQVHIVMGLIRQGDTYLLQRRSLDRRRGAAGLVGCFGGKINSGEAPVEAVCRELAEETTLRLDSDGVTRIGQVQVVSDHNHEPVVVTAEVYAVVLPADMAVAAQEGALVAWTRDQALGNRDKLTPATRAVFEELL